MLKLILFGALLLLVAADQNEKHASRRKTHRDSSSSSSSSPSSSSSSSSESEIEGICDGVDSVVINVGHFTDEEEERCRNLREIPQYCSCKRQVRKTRGTRGKGKHPPKQHKHKSKVTQPRRHKPRSGPPKKGHAEPQFEVKYRY